MTRHCAFCSKPLLPTRLARAVYCDDNCAKAASDQRRAVKKWRKANTPSPYDLVAMHRGMRSAGKGKA